MRILIILFIASVPAGLFAQSYDEGYSHHQLGIEASMLSGLGATYSYIFDSLYRVKTTVWAYYQDEGNGISYWTASFGIQFERTFLTTDVTRFYGLAGGFYYTHIDNGSSINYLSDGSPFSGSYSNAEHDFAAGFGIGIEFMIWKHVAINFDGTFEFAGVTYKPAYSAPSKYLGPGGGIGASYRF